MTIEKIKQNNHPLPAKKSPLRGLGNACYRTSAGRDVSIGCRGRLDGEKKLTWIKKQRKFRVLTPPLPNPVISTSLSNMRWYLGKKDLGKVDTDLTINHVSIRLKSMNVRAMLWSQCRPGVWDKNDREKKGFKFLSNIFPEQVFG